MKMIKFACLFATALSDDSLEMPSALLSVPSVLANATREKLLNHLACIQERTGVSWVRGIEKEDEANLVFTLTKEPFKSPCTPRGFSFGADGFSLFTKIHSLKPVVVHIESASEAGLLAGVRRFLRNIAMTHKTASKNGNVHVSSNLCKVGAGTQGERWPVRGHQLAVSQDLTDHIYI